MRYSDKPIIRPDQDVLGRSGFALELARAIDALSVASDGFVIGIIGEWGSGKSSIIELIVRYLRHLEMERCSQVSLFGESEAAPRSLDQLEEMGVVFDKIESRIVGIQSRNLDVTLWDQAYCKVEFRRWLGSDEPAALAHRYWLLKSRVDKAPRTTVVRFSPWLIAGNAALATALLSDLARAVGETFDSNVNAAFADLLKRLSELAPVAGAAVDVMSGMTLGGLFRGAGEWSKKFAENLSTGSTLDEIRNHLRATLAIQEGRRLLVIIDDLDRLTPAEALEMVSLVKSLGDLPNVIYILSYDDTKLAELLRCAMRVDGHNFLEKIIQYPVNLPPADKDDLVNLLEADLVGLLGDLSEDERRRLGHTWPLVFQHYLRTPRDVRRYVNSVAVALSAAKDHVNPIDVALFEVLRLFEPKIYWWLRRNLEEVTE